MLGPNKEPYNKTYINNYNNFYAWPWVIMQNVFFFFPWNPSTIKSRQRNPKNTGFQPLIDNVIILQKNGLAKLQITKSHLLCAILF